MLDENGEWWARREVKPNKTAPENFVSISTDPNTGKTVGWEPIAQSGFAAFHFEALTVRTKSLPGTYELCGPKINKNPERLDQHVLVPHEKARWIRPFGLTFEDLKETMKALRSDGIEGLVWHHPDGRMVKLKCRDFPLDEDL